MDLQSVVVSVVVNTFLFLRRSDYAAIRTLRLRTQPHARPGLHRAVPRPFRRPHRPSGLHQLDLKGPRRPPLPSRNGLPLRQLLRSLSLFPFRSGIWTDQFLLFCPPFLSFFFFSHSCLFPEKKRRKKILLTFLTPFLLWFYVGWFSFAANKRVAVSAAISGVLVFSSENGGDPGPTSLAPASHGTQVRVRAQDGSENGALRHGQTQLEVAIRHALRLP